MCKVCLDLVFLQFLLHFSTISYFFHLRLYRCWCKKHVKLTVLKQNWTKMSKKSHRVKIEFSYFREPPNLSSRVTGTIWEVFTGKYFFFKIPTDLGPKTSILRSKNMISDPPGDPYMPTGGSKRRFLDLKIDVFVHKSVGILRKKYFPVNTSQMTPVTQLDRFECSRK